MYPAFPGVFGALTCNHTNQISNKNERVNLKTLYKKNETRKERCSKKETRPLWIN